MWITYSTANALIPTAIALGNFDGVHRGHQRVIQPVLNFVRCQKSEASREGQKKAQGTQGENLIQNPLAPAPENAYPTVVTFNPHPQEFFSGQARALLTPLAEKAQQLSSWGIEQLVLLPFDRELAARSPQDFVEKILVQQLHTQMISVGEDFCFGKRRSGTATDLQAIASNFGIPVTIVPNFTCEGNASDGLRQRISSSAIRGALAQGNLQRAKQLLDRPYILTGTVAKGQQLGRTIGFPTANIQLPPNKFIPRLGVYAVRVFVEGEKPEVRGSEEGERLDNTLSQPLLPEDNPPSSLQLVGFGVMNIGTRPTVNGVNQSVEVHILDWTGDLYGKTIIVQLEEFLRPEQKFASLEELKAQIIADCAKAKSLF